YIHQMEAKEEPNPDKPKTPFTLPGTGGSGVVHPTEGHEGSELDSLRPPQQPDPPSEEDLQAWKARPPSARGGDAAT
ncbi:MAG: hypothetical protein KDD55_03495, partial [Bdellovibrionales bacterium]|nr:hypothetical protein [Bdellovibrionales bacterium]